MELECRKFGTEASEGNHLVDWLQQHQVREVVLESTASTGSRCWLDLEPHFEKLPLAQAQSNRAPNGILSTPVMIWHNLDRLERGGPLQAFLWF
jgi:hypothetical protein